MYCLDARRILTATPDTTEVELQEHLHQCPACTRHAEEVLNFTRQIETQLSVAVPEGLSSRILLQHGLAEERRSRLHRHYWQALAASVLLTVGLVSGMLMVNAPYSLEEVALAHVQEESMALQAEGDIQLSQLNDMLAPYQLKLQQAIGQVAFAMPCHIRQYAGAHLVVEGEHGKVTVLIMPGEYVMARKNLQKQNLQALLIPTETGSIAIIGQPKEPLEAIEARLNQALVHTA